MSQADAVNSADDVSGKGLDLLVFRAVGLQADQADNGLEVVFDSMVNFINYCGF